MGSNSNCDWLQWCWSAFAPAPDDGISPDQRSDWLNYLRAHYAMSIRIERSYKEEVYYLQDTRARFLAEAVRGMSAHVAYGLRLTGAEVREPWVAAVFTTLNEASLGRSAMGLTLDGPAFFRDPAPFAFKAGQLHIDVKLPEQSPHAARAVADEIAATWHPYAICSGTANWWDINVSKAGEQPVYFLQWKYGSAHVTVTNGAPY